jgi:hypothetical protein
VLCPLGHRAIVRHDRAGIAEGAEIFRWIETERRCGAKCADRLAVAGADVRLAAILDDRQIVPRRHLGQRFHIRRLAVQVDRHDGRGLRRNRRGDGARIDRQTIGIDVGEHGTRAGHHDRERRVRGGQRRGDHLVARLDADGAQRDRQSVGAVADADGVRRPRRVSELPLERLELRAENEPSARDDPRDCLADRIGVVGQREL